MAGPVSGLDTLAIKSGEQAIAFGLGIALGAILSPDSTGIRQSLWADDPNLALDPKEAAAVAAEDVESVDWAKGEAAQHGINADRFQALLGEVLNAPGVGELLRMLRRGTITSAQFDHGLRKSKFETLWDDALTELQGERLDPQEIAKAIHRGIMVADDLLVALPPTTPGRVPIVPQSPLDSVTEAAASGVDAERLRVLVGNAGLPPGIVQMLQLLNRGEITADDFLRGVGESNLRNEWGPAILALRRQLLTPHEYEEAALRGIITNAQADAGAALHGMTADDAHLLFEIMGRPLAVHQITTGLARGGEYGGTYDDVPEPYRDAIRRSNIRPEYARLAHANRYSYPSAFVLRALAAAGELSADDVEQILLDIGWPPDLAAKVAPLWAAGGGGKADPHVTKAEGQLWTALHKSYLKSEATTAQAHTTLTLVGVAPDAQAQVLKLWDAERALIRESLTAAQIKKAIGQQGKDHAWAMERLAEIGYDEADATVFLAE